MGTLKALCWDGMKMYEKMLERRLRKLINGMQFGYSSGNDTTARKTAHKDLFVTFVDLKKAYNRVPRYLIYWCQRRTASHRS